MRKATWVAITTGNSHSAPPAGRWNNRTKDVASGAADGLHERGDRSEEPLLVGVEDRHERDLGQVQPLAQQVDADQHVELAQPEPAHDLHALDRVDVRVQVLHPQLGLA